MGSKSVLLDQANPYRPSLPEVLHLDAEDFEFKLSDENDRALGRQAEWLVVAYMAANCNLAEYLFDNLQEMKAVGSGPNMHVCVSFAGPMVTDTFFARLNPGTKLSEDVVARYTSVKSNDPNLLGSMLRLAQRYPAKRRLVFLCGHGRGWKGALLNQSLGLAYINGPKRLESPGSPAECQARLLECQKRVQDYISSKGNGDGKTAPDPFEIMAFDACYMGNIEAVAEFVSSARTFLVSEGRAPGQGLPYRRILADLQSNPSQSTEDVANQIILANQAAYGSSGTSVTQTAVSSAAFTTMIGAFTALVHQLDLDDASTFAGVRAAMENSAALGGTGNIDLRGFVVELLNHSIPASVRELGKVLLEKLALLAPNANGSIPAGGSGSLSVYGPLPEDFDPDYISMSGKLPLGLHIWAWFLGDYYLQRLGSKGPGHPLLRAIQKTMEDMIRRGIYPPQKG
jgi:hypothetical protein